MKTTKANVTAILLCVIAGGGVIEDQRYETSGQAINESGALCYCIIELQDQLIPAVQFTVDAVVSNPENKK